MESLGILIAIATMPADLEPKQERDRVEIVAMKSDPVKIDDDGVPGRKVGGGTRCKFLWSF